MRFGAGLPQTRGVSDRKRNRNLEPVGLNKNRVMISEKVTESSDFSSTPEKYRNITQFYVTLIVPEYFR